LSRDKFVCQLFVFRFCGVALYERRNFGLHFFSGVGLVFLLSYCVPCVFCVVLFLVHTVFVVLTAFLDKVEENLPMIVLLLFRRRQKLLGQFEGFVLSSLPR